MAVCSKTSARPRRPTREWAGGSRARCRLSRRLSTAGIPGRGSPLPGTRARLSAPGNPGPRMTTGPASIGRNVSAGRAPNTGNPRSTRPPAWTSGRRSRGADARVMRPDTRWRSGDVSKLRATRATWLVTGINRSFGGPVAARHPSSCCCDQHGFLIDKTFGTTLAEGLGRGRQAVGLLLGKAPPPRHPHPAPTVDAWRRGGCQPQIMSPGEASATTADSEVLPAPSNAGIRKAKAVRRTTAQRAGRMRSNVGIPSRAGQLFPLRHKASSGGKTVGREIRWTERALDRTGQRVAPPGSVHEAVEAERGQQGRLGASDQPSSQRPVLGNRASAQSRCRLLRVLEAVGQHIDAHRHPVSRVGMDDHVLHAVTGVGQGSKEVREVLGETRVRRSVEEFGVDEIHASDFPKRANGGGRE